MNMAYEKVYGQTTTPLVIVVALREVLAGVDRRLLRERERLSLPKVFSYVSSPRMTRSVTRGMMTSRKMIPATTHRRITMIFTVSRCMICLSMSQ